MMNNEIIENKLITSFWNNRFSECCKKYGVKTGRENRRITEFELDVVQSVTEGIIKGIGDVIPKEKIEVHGGKRYISQNTYGVEAEVTYEDKRILRFRLEFTDRNICCCGFVYNYLNPGFSLAGINIKLCNPVLIGKIMAELYSSHVNDSEECKKMLMKFEKVHQMRLNCIKAVVQNHLKDTKMTWAVIDNEDGKVVIEIKMVSGKQLKMSLNTNSFGDNYKEITDTINLFVNSKIDNLTGVSFRNRKK